MLKSQEKQLDENKEVVNTPLGSITLDIHPGTKVEIIGTKLDVNGKTIPVEQISPFIVSQKLKNGNLAILGDEGLILEIKPENVRNIK